MLAQVLAMANAVMKTHAALMPPICHTGAWLRSRSEARCAHQVFACADFFAVFSLPRGFMPVLDPIIAIVGNTKTSPGAAQVATELGRELAKQGFRILVYESSPDYL